MTQFVYKITYLAFSDSSPTPTKEKIRKKKQNTAEIIENTINEIIVPDEGLRLTVIPNIPDIQKMTPHHIPIPAKTWR